MKKSFTKYIFNIGFLSRLYKKLLLLNNKINNPILKISKDFYSYFTNEHMLMTNKHRKRYSTSVDFKEFKINHKEISLHTH